MYVKYTIQYLDHRKCLMAVTVTSFDLSSRVGSRGLSQAVFHLAFVITLSFVNYYLHVTDKAT